MIGLILATCIAAHDCKFEIVEMKNEWMTLEQCTDDVPQTLTDLGIELRYNQSAYCDEVTQ